MHLGQVVKARAAEVGYVCVMMLSVVAALLLTKLKLVVMDMGYRKRLRRASTIGFSLS